MRKKTFGLLLFLLSCLFLLIGCGGGGGGGGGGTTEPTPGERLTSAWSSFDSKDFTTAESTFDQVIAQATSTDAQKAEAYGGKGLSAFRAKDTANALTSFDKALNLVPTLTFAEEGKSEALLADPTAANISSAIVLLNDVIQNDPNFAFTHGEKPDIADVYALLSYAYLLQEDFSLALENANLALIKDATQPLALKVMTILADLGQV